MSKQWRSITVLAFVMTIAVAIFAGAQSSQATSDTYTWNGEFVSLDTTAKTMAVKSRVAYQEAISELKHFKAGDRVWIWWSGVHDASNAVRQVRRPGARCPRLGPSSRANGSPSRPDTGRPRMTRRW